MKTGTIEYQPFEVTVPDLSGTNVERIITIQVPVEWDDESKEWLMTEEGSRLVEETKARAMGLILPAEMKSLRERLGYTQKQMGELFQVGAKSWTRWESARHRPSRVISLLILALYEDAISLDYLIERSGKKVRRLTPWIDVILGEVSASPHTEWKGLIGSSLQRNSAPRFKLFTARTGEQIRHSCRSEIVLSPSRRSVSSNIDLCIG